MTYQSENDAASKIELYKSLDVLKAYNAQTRTNYFASNDMSKDRIMSLWGEHLFVAFLNNIISDADNAIFHSAAVGIDGNGVLICGRSGAGKSTLTVSALSDGFDFISEDYLILNKTNGLYAYPIYSISSLTQSVIVQMSELQYEFLYDNVSKTKHVIDLSAHHNGFVKKLPIQAVIFPNISGTEKPSIERIKKDKAIVQMAHSTILQLCTSIHRKHMNYIIRFNNDWEPIRQLTCCNNTAEHMKHLLSFTEHLDFYQINLSPDFRANVDILREFISGLGEFNWNNERKIYVQA
jgi:hypothetical protein